MDNFFLLIRKSMIIAGAALFMQIGTTSLAHAQNYDLMEDVACGYCVWDTLQSGITTNAITVVNTSSIALSVTFTNLNSGSYGCFSNKNIQFTDTYCDLDNATVVAYADAGMWVGGSYNLTTSGDVSNICAMDGRPSTPETISLQYTAYYSCHRYGSDTAPPVPVSVVGTVNAGSCPAVP